MSDLRTAAQQALEALEGLSEPYYVLKAQDALRAALEQPEQTNPWRDAVDHELSTLHMVASDDPRESIRRLIDWHCAVQIDPLVSSAAQELIERGKREALAEPVQEPVDAEAALRFALAQRDWAFKQLHAQPDRREWRSLNEEEIWLAIKSCGTAYGLEVNSIARAVEAALRSKNYD
jgi:hypothetical protein